MSDKGRLGKGDGWPYTGEWGKITSGDMIERYALSPMRDLWTSEARYRRWLRVELAALEALEDLGIVPLGTAKEVRDRAEIDIPRIAEIEREIGHDLIAFLWALEERVGEAGRWLHYGLTSSDVKDTALSLAMVQGLRILQEKAAVLRELLWGLARRYRDTVVMGRTHGQYAEPMVLGLKFLRWYDELERCEGRLAAAVEVISVGKLSGAVGTYAYFPPEAEAQALSMLGLRPCRVASQVVPRDRHAQVLWALASIGTFVEEIALEVRHLSRSEVAEATEGRPEGSSAMPHKRNPILSERLCGLARLLRSNLIPALEDVSLWHERDMSHSSVERIVIPQAFILADYMLQKARELLEGLVFFPERMLRRVLDARGIPFSEGLLLALVRAGMSRRRAHLLVQELVRRAEEGGVELLDVARADPRVRELLDEGELRAVFDLRGVLRNVGEIYRRFAQGNSGSAGHSPG